VRVDWNNKNYNKQDSAMDLSDVMNLEVIRDNAVFDTLCGEWLDVGTDALIKPTEDVPVWRTQCQVDNCSRLTVHDYRMCDAHLLEYQNLIVAPSRIPGAGLGLFAMDVNLTEPDVLRLLKKGPCAYADERLCPSLSRTKHNVFQHKDIIGQFGGEIVPVYILNHRYRETLHGTYVVAIDDVYCHDESRVRTALAYANDGIHLDDALRRRNYVYRTGTHVVYHDLGWPHVINARCIRESDMDFSQLAAIGSIGHGEEILWSYDCRMTPTLSRDGYWGDVP
jgi:hypothetical protein